MIVANIETEKKMYMKSLKLLSVLSAVALSAAAFMASCDKEDAPKKISHITDPEKLAMLNSMKDLDGTGRLYEIDYTVDYKLDEILKAGVTDVNDLFKYIAYLLYDNLDTKAPKVTFGAGCSAFAVPEKDRINFLMGRNYDFRHSDDSGYKPTAAILVHTAPKDGKKSISMVDGMNLDFGQGFYTDKNKDLSLLMGLPYAALDGINEDGFAIGVLALKEKQTSQHNGYPRIGTTVAIRMLLDRASTVKEAVEMLRHYDMDMQGNGRSNYHFFMADATGDYAIVEYTYDDDDNGDEEEKHPSKMEVFTANDTLRCVTNFYVAPSMVGTVDGWGSSHGKARYETMRNTLLSKNYSLNADDAMSLLKAVSQPPTEELTSQTQWSALYDLTERTLRLTILRDYASEYKFKVE